MTINTKQTGRVLSALRELVRATQALKHEREAMYAALAAVRGKPITLGERLSLAEHVERLARRREQLADEEDIAELLQRLNKRG